MPNRWIIEIFLKKEFCPKCSYWHVEIINNIDDYKKPVDNLRKEKFFTKLENECPDVDEIERTKKLLKYLILKMEKN